MLLCCATYILLLLVLQPCAEYWLHRLAHACHLHTHVSHHALYYNRRFATYSGNVCTWCTILGLAVAQQWLLCAMLLQYEVVHTLSHRQQTFYMHEHHAMHHKNATVNFGVSAAWPDYVFGTRAQRGLL